MSNQPSRRAAIKNMVAGTAALGTTGLLSSFGLAGPGTGDQKLTPLKGNIHHSVCRWCYGDIPLEDFCIAVKKIGIPAIDLVGPADWPVLKRHGIYSSMCNGAEISLTKGWNHLEYHATLIKNYTEHIGLVAKAGYKNLICFSGNREGMDEETGWKNCVAGLKQIIGLAEQQGVTIHMELLNSKINHPDQMCDNTKWGVELVKRVGSANFKLLYDIYHMQIDEGDVIRTIQDHHQYFGHYHTGGVPGRHEIDETQELYYPAIMKAILATGFSDYVAQEFVPSWPDKLKALEQGVRICDV
ncbi:MAG: TIM barrel protein [Bacteroidota bacterium]|nr:TIM barrel protein [Bacteroidota bacterium]MDP4217816.1 TIM barrel protein [Bacteroidota bacterium]MDP4247384.1 TIM barrel protein [Bacteroidota bacterium]MDP4254052.1 TIM barrel protein [Bacteroidota bacterium]MDP4258162.1 TIM barrel protein [Bacteroidota bacterium]